MCFKVPIIVSLGSPQNEFITSTLRIHITTINESEVVGLTFLKRQSCMQRSPRINWFLYNIDVSQEKIAAFSYNSDGYHSL